MGRVHRASLSLLRILVFILEEFESHQMVLCECMCMSEHMCILFEVYVKNKHLKGCMCVHIYITGSGRRVVRDYICTLTQSHWLGYREEIQVGIRLHVGTG